MKIRLLSVGVMALSLSGCAGPPVQMHAFEGPIAAANPGLVIKAASHGQGNVGTLAYALPDGAACSGKWERITHKTATGLLPDNGMVVKHGGVQSLGEGGMIFHAGNNAQIAGNGKCSDGTTFVWVSVANGYKARGALKDSNGNMFKIILR